MPREYLKDIFGKIRKRKAHITDIEAKATDKFFIKGKISDKNIAMAFDEIGAKFMDLIRVNGQSTFD